MMKTYRLSIFIGAVVFLISCEKKETATVEGNKETSVPVVSKTYTPNTTVYGSNRYIRFIVGDANSPIILASPHDGDILPTNMSARTNPNAVTVRDVYVTDLVEEIAASLYAKTKIHPHIIINDVARSRMEPNRSLDETYQSDAANALWKEYHTFLKDARDMVQKNAGKGLFLDMHGHGHDKDRVEVGYIVSRDNLNANDATLNGVANTSSIYYLATGSSYTFSQLIRGDYAFGTLLANEGIPAVPSKTDPTPNKDDYFNGGYCTLAYGSKNGGTVSAIQLETQGNGVRNNATQRKAAGAKIANAIIRYMKSHYGIFLDVKL